MATYALHGFLGTPRDWQSILPNAICPNLFEEVIPYRNWAKKFNATVKPSSLLVGYSMGGRLAMHALIENPKLWKAAIIVSANPGTGREMIDWSQRFLHEPWDLLMESWNSQPLFDGVKIPRHEADFSRKALSQAMQTWSIAKQENLPIETLDIPILWIVGQKDIKYKEMAAGIHLKHPRSKISIAPEAGHRVPWQQKTWFQNEVKSFYDNNGYMD